MVKVNTESREEALEFIDELEARGGTNIDEALQTALKLRPDDSKRPYIVVGFIALLLLVPLAATSWKGAMRRLGSQAWCRLHRLSYVVVILGAVHFIMQEKVWTLESLAYLAVAALLVGARALWLRSL